MGDQRDAVSLEARRWASAGMNRMRRGDRHSGCKVSFGSKREKLRVSKSSPEYSTKGTSCGAWALRRADNLKAIEQFAARLDILPFGKTAAAHYGQVRAKLERAGRPGGSHHMQIGGMPAVKG